LQSSSTPFNRWHHRTAIFVACAALAVIVAGALVTSEDAGLSVPDWPTSYGHYFRLPPWVGGIVYEHSHRMIAFFTGALTTVIAVWTLWVDHRRSMKLLGLAALGTIVVQGILGGLTVRHFLPPAISTAHAAVAQTFFSIAVLIAVLTGRRWVEEDPAVAAEGRRPTSLALGILSIPLLYIQLILGAMFRHHGMPWWPHVLNAALVSVVLTWTAVQAMLEFPRVNGVRRPAVLLLFLVVIQLCLGFAAFLTRVVWGSAAPQPEFSMVVATVAHVATGALILATTAVLTIELWRLTPVAEERVAVQGTATASF
jgi:cytochrome c oxidase assembly protein subunit 15